MTVVLASPAEQQVQKEIKALKAVANASMPRRRRPARFCSNPASSRRRARCIPAIADLSVRGAFFEGKALYAGAKIMAKTHIQVCVRQFSSIHGCFRPIARAV